MVVFVRRNYPCLKWLHNVYTECMSAVFVFEFVSVFVFVIYKAKIASSKRLHNVYTGWMSATFVFKFVFVFVYVKYKAKLPARKGYTMFTLGGCRRCGEQKEVRRLH